MPETVMSETVPPVADILPFCVSDSPVTVTLFCSCNLAPTATTVPFAVVPSAVLFWMFRMPAFTFVTPV
jgi:hypothetical protein